MYRLLATWIECPRRQIWLSHKVGFAWSPDGRIPTYRVSFSWRRGFYSLRESQSDARSLIMSWRLEVSGQRPELVGMKKRARVSGKLAIITRTTHLKKNNTPSKQIRKHERKLPCWMSILPSTNGTTSLCRSYHGYNGRRILLLKFLSKPCMEAERQTVRKRDDEKRNNRSFRNGKS